MSGKNLPVAKPILQTIFTSLFRQMQYTLKKSLGQHFLHDESVCKKIVDAVGQAKGNLLEIGPGAGAITKYLKDLPFDAYRCIELDTEKVHFLEKTYPDLKGKILNEDFLQSNKPFDQAFAVVGNFPYNISSQILFKVLEWRDEVITVTGMFQKEVAERITATHGSKMYGILSVLVQTYYHTEYLFDVEPAAFTPPPKVMSGVIQLRRKTEPDAIANYDGFRRFVKTAFNQRRKTLRNGFKSNYPAEVLLDAIFQKRAEQLSVSEFIHLFTRLQT